MPFTDTKYSVYPKCLCNFGFWGFVMLYVEVVLLWQTSIFKTIIAMYAEMLQQSHIYKAAKPWKPILYVR